MSNFFRLRPLFLLALLLGAANAQAMTEGPIAGYVHTGWTQSDGAPAEVRGIVQDDEGWLWMAGPSGLYRFDGDRFERITAIGGHPLHKSDIVGLSWIDGALWIGYQFGGAERFSLRDGSSTYFGEASGLPRATVYQFAGGAGGVVSAGTMKGLYEWRGKGWSLAWPPPGTPAEPAWRLHRNTDGALLMQVGMSHILRRAAGAAQFEQVDSDDGHTVALIPGRNGGFWAQGPKSDLMEYDAATRRLRRGAPTHRTGDASDLIFLRDGSDWMVRGQSVELLADTKRFRMVDELTRARGLSDGTVITHFEDREGNLWLGTNGGIDRIRRGKVHPVSLPNDVHDPGIAPGDGGSVWITSIAGGPLRQYGPDGVIRATTLRSAENITRGADGTIWAADARRLYRYAHGKEASWRLPVQQQVQFSVQDRDGSLWLSILGAGELYHLRDGAWEKNTARRGYAETTIALAIDERNRLWQSYTDNRLAVADGDTVTRYTVKDGLRVGNVQSFAMRNGHVWAGGEQALMFLRDGRFVTLSGADGGDFIGVSGIVETAGGDLWLNGLQGITHIAAAELRRALSSSSARVAFERFDYHDGVVGQAPHIRPLPSLTEGPDGRIWYATNSSVGSIDPAHIARNSLAPPVLLRDLVADGIAFAPAPKTLHLAERNNNLRIDYTALALSMPERMRFRYRLTGVDTDWVDAGQRRSAYYTALKPGAYHFQVQAANEDGVWNRDGAAQDFTVAPTLAQTTWFRALCALALLALLWLAFRWRLAQLAARMRVRMTERIDERTRIARALHDTILQSVQGVILHIHAVSSELPIGDPVRGRLDRVLDKAEKAYVQGRGEVTKLRTSPAGDIEGTIAETGEHLLAAHPETAFELFITGKRARLRDTAAEEVAEIAREAVRNAFYHAAAATITVKLDYGADCVTLIVRDDGKGITTQAADGHWGLVGMRERAARIKGKLSVDGKCAPGTSIRLTVPARQIYADRHRWSWRR